MILMKLAVSRKPPVFMKSNPKLIFYIDFVQRLPTPVDDRTCSALISFRALLCAKFPFYSSEVASITEQPIPQEFDFFRTKTPSIPKVKTQSRQVNLRNERVLILGHHLNISKISFHKFFFVARFKFIEVENKIIKGFCMFR